MVHRCRHTKFSASNDFRQELQLQAYQKLHMRLDLSFPPSTEAILERLEATNLPASHQVGGICETRFAQVRPGLSLVCDLMLSPSAAQCHKQ